MKKSCINIVKCSKRDGVVYSYWVQYNDEFGINSALFQNQRSDGTYIFAPYQFDRLPKAVQRFCKEHTEEPWSSWSYEGHDYETTRYRKKYRYTLERCSAPTAFSSQHETNSIKEVRKFIREYGKEVSADISVWDNETHENIYWKRCFCYKPEVNLLER